jgi:hypothetical protein
MTFDQFIRPAVMDLISDVEPRAYRRERCFHHHFIACLSRHSDLRLGHRDNTLKPEAVTGGRYTWTGINPRRGNIDFKLFDTPIELNYAYCSTRKIAIDFCKLLDDENEFHDGVYLAFSHRCGFRNSVELGYRTALELLMRSHQVMRLSRRLDVIVVEDSRTRGNRGAMCAWEAHVTLLDRGTLDWHPILFEK